MNFVRHIPAFYTKITTYFELKPGDLFLDLTLGDGGHSQEALEVGARVVSFDVDAEAVSRAVDFLSPRFSPIIVNPETISIVPKDFKWLIVRANFASVGEIKEKLKLPQFKAVLADLGTSQYQLATAERGFSFNLDGPLDMRLDQRLGVTAKDLVNALSENELTQLFLLADEYKAKAIARAITQARKESPITTTNQLVSIISEAKRAMPGKINPATKTFMALRMAVNLERESLTKMLDETPNLLEKGGILGVISFHSGEDRLVKHFIKTKKKDGTFRVINVKPIKPDQTELQTNPKVRSAKLRLAQKI